MRKSKNIGSMTVIGLIIFGSAAYYLNVNTDNSIHKQMTKDSTVQIGNDSILINDVENSPFKNGILFDTNGKTLPFRILFPGSHDTLNSYPLIIFYHGSGERGADNEKQLIHSKKLFLSPDFRKNFPCYVLLPQCPEDFKWVDADWTADYNNLTEEMTEPLRLSKILIEKISRVYKADTNRLYAIGMSMGGFGVWDIISRYPGLFAAAIPICGGGDLKYASRIKNVPVWAFHGEDDRVVKVARSRDMINAIRNEGGSPLYTEYKNTGHGSWVNAFSEPEFFKWLFSNRKK